MISLNYIIGEPAVPVEHRPDPGGLGKSESGKSLHTGYPDFFTLYYR